MALYRRGTASMDADGTVHGTDTKWKDQLALIRVGATIVFLEQPIKLAVISDIVSDTELKAISTDGQTAANGKYVILLNDSLTVNGLAQNVAETLRYYQSKETEIASALDIIANLDMDNLQKIINQVNQAKLDAEAAKNQAELARDAANAARDAANATKGQVQQIVDGAVGSINAAKDQAITNVQQKENSAVTHINTEEAAAIQAINDAKGDLSGYVNDAQTAAQTATSAKNDAQAARDAAVSAKDAAAASAQEAKDAANSVDAGNLLHKDKNLSDVSNVETARSNLKVNRLQQTDASQTNIRSGNDKVQLYVNDSKEWGCYDLDGGKRVSLPLTSGGTGGLNDAEARGNLRVYKEEAINAFTGSVNLDTMTGDKSGFYRNPANSNATPENNYPEKQAGFLQINKTIGNTKAVQCVQQYHTYQNNKHYSRCRDETGFRPWVLFTVSTVSDERMKDIKGDMNTECALDNINRMEFKIFRFNDDAPGKSARRGVISQQIRSIDKEYTTEVGGYLHLDRTPLLLDGLAAIKALRTRDEENKKKISDLESKLSSLEGMIKKMIESR